MAEYLTDKLTPSALERQYIGIVLGLYAGTILFSYYFNFVKRNNNNFYQLVSIFPLAISAFLGGYIAGKIAMRNWLIVGFLSSVALLNYANSVSYLVFHPSTPVLRTLYISILISAMVGALLGEKRFFIKCRNPHIKPMLNKPEFISINNLTKLLILSLIASAMLAALSALINYQVIRDIDTIGSYRLIIIKINNFTGKAEVLIILAWFYFTYRNLFALGISGTRTSPVWASCYYIIPILNLFRPYQILKELWKGGNITVSPKTNQSWKSASVSPIIAWWLFFILLRALTNLFYFIASIYSFIFSLDIDRLILINNVGITSRYAISVFSSIILIFIVREISKRQEKKYSLFALELAETK